MIPDIRLGKFAGDYFKWLLVFSVATNILLLAAPLHMLQIYDRVLSSGSRSTLFYLTVFVLVALAMGGFADYIRRLLAQRLATRYVVETSNRLLKALSQSEQSAQKGAKTLRDFNVVKNFLTSRTLIGLFDLPFTPFFLLFMFLLNIWLGLIVLLGLCAMLGLGYLNKKATAPGQSASQKADSDALGFASVSLTKSEEVRAMGLLPSLQQRWGLKLLKALNSADDAGQHMSAYASGSKLLRKAVQIIVISCGAFLVLAGDMSGGMIFAATMITNRVLSPVDQLIGGWDSIVRAQSAHLAVTETIDTTEATDTRLKLPEPAGHISVENVGFAPDLKIADKPVLDGVSFEISPGEIVVATGPSGSGKSTLARLLSGALRPTSGRIRLDGADQDQWRSAQWGQAIGYVAQEIQLFPVSIAENITRLSYDFDEEKLLKASRRAGVHQMITSMPDGYNTMVETGGYRLSGGQKQRIALARALYGDPKFLILDEPDANLDREGEKLLVRALEKMRDSGVAVFVVSHRRRIVETADRVLSVEDGKVAEKKRSRDGSSRSRKSSSKRVAELPGGTRRQAGTSVTGSSAGSGTEKPLSDIQSRFAELKRLSKQNSERNKTQIREAV